LSAFEGVLGVAFEDKLGRGTCETQTLAETHVVVPIADEGKAIGVEEQEGAIIEENDGEAHKEGHKDDVGDGKEVAEEEGSLFVDLEHVYEVLHMRFTLLREVGPLLLVQTRQKAVHRREEGCLTVIDQFLQECPPGVVQREHWAASFFGGDRDGM